MSLFGVLLIENEPEVRQEIGKQIETKYNKAFQVTENFYIVSTVDKSTQKIAETLGIYGDSEEEASLGIVFRLNGSYSGFADGEIWDWLDEEAKAPTS